MSNEKLAQDDQKLQECVCRLVGAMRKYKGAYDRYNDKCMNEAAQVIPKCLDALGVSLRDIHEGQEKSLSELAPSDSLVADLLEIPPFCLDKQPVFLANTPDQPLAFISATLDRYEEALRQHEKRSRKQTKRNRESQPSNGGQMVDDHVDTTIAQACIAPEDCTKPMSYKKAAYHMGKGNSKDAAEWLSKCVTDGTVACIHRSRQSHIFSKQDFSKEAWPAILPR